MASIRFQFLLAFCKLLSSPVLAVAMMTLPTPLRAEEDKPGTDVLIFVDDEKLVGKLLRSTGDNVTFKSNMAGEVTVPWSKIKELKSPETYAVVEKQMKLGKADTSSKIPQGPINVEDQKLEIKTGAEGFRQKIPVTETAYILDQSTFERAILRNPPIYSGWRGAITAGASLVEATQQNRIFTGNLNLVRSIPNETWLDARNRTIVNFNAAYGLLRDRVNPDVRTEIFHADAERDQYFTSRLYAFAQTAFDHNFSQGLELQQAHGGGIGWTVIKRESEQLDLKASVTYLRQRFQDVTQDQNLIGSTFAENYTKKFSHGILFNEQFFITPAWSNLEAYTAGATVSLTIPVYKRLNVTLGTIDTFLNNPPPGFRKNSFQLNTGLSYTMP